MREDKFNYAIDFYLKNEGGYQAFPQDTGNYNSKGELVGTNFGVSAKKYESYIGIAPTKETMQNMAKSTAINIYKIDWNKWKLETINDVFIASHIFDILENHGFTNGSKIVQRTINYFSVAPVSVDGILGSKSISSINQIISNGQTISFNTELVNERKNFYNQIGNDTFITGWLNRASKYINYKHIAISVLPTFIAIGIFFLH